VVTIAILGGGFMGASHAASYRALGERVRVKTVGSRRSERAAAVAALVDAELTDDLMSVLGDPEVDAVDICLPTPLHREWAEASFAAGKHVLLEKPIALRLDDADAIVAAAVRSGRFLMVGLVLRFWPEYVELRRRVANGELGRPLSVFTQRLSPRVDWNDWMGDPASSGGVPVDLLVHDFDQMNWLLGLPRRVFARAPRPDHVLAVVEYDGAEGIAEGSMAMPKAYPFSSNVRVLAEDGVAEYAFSAAPAEDGGNIGVSDAPRGLRLYLRDRAEPLSVPVEPADPWGPEIKYFVECLERGRAPEQGSGAQARAALAVSLAAARSLESGRFEAVS
jgi:UDP-N-acetylglucosamine 3-dehydrogenase